MRRLQEWSLNGAIRDRLIVLQVAALVLCLVACANEAGGKDNITVVVAHFRTANQAAAPAQTHICRAEGNGKTEPVTASCR